MSGSYGRLGKGLPVGPPLSVEKMMRLEADPTGPARKTIAILIPITYRHAAVVCGEKYCRAKPWRKLRPYLRRGLYRHPSVFVDSHDGPTGL